MRFHSRLRRIERALRAAEPAMPSAVPDASFTPEERQGIFNAMLARFGLLSQRALVLRMLAAPNFTPELASSLGGRAIAFEEDGSIALAVDGEGGLDVDVVNDEPSADDDEPGADDGEFLT